MIRTAGKQFNPDGERIYFIASGVSGLQMVQNVNKHMLVAVNEISDKTLPVLDKFIAKGITLFIDSGVFNLTNEHARKHGTSMDEALGLAPNEIEGFDDLLQRYLTICKNIGERSWGYIEIDQGGRENKIKTRAMLEKEGLRPIPVYHPLNDGWEYFDYLAERYDRICVGNVVQAEAPLRKRIIATVTERQKAKYPKLWIHLLGVTPYNVTFGCPTMSCDSSSWLTAIRWSASAREWACGQPVSHFDDEMIYRQSDDTHSAAGHSKSTKLHAMQNHMLCLNWRAFCKRVEELT